MNAFTGITAAAFAGALASADYLVIPELENGNLGAALSAAAKAVVSNFVAAGHCLIINGANGWDTNFVNQVFGHTVSAAGSFLGIASTGTAARAATAFAGGPAVLPANNAVWLWLRASLPAGAVSVYELTNAATAYTSVAILPEGRGRVIFLAYDWYDAVPGGTQDGGWDQTLGLALSQCGATDLIDSDGDGLPNWWEILHGLDPSDNGSGDPNQGAAGDPDGDDQTNLEEFYAGTDPRDPNSVFEILVHKPGTGTVVAGSRPVEITIPTVSGRTYSVWFQDDLLAPGGIWKSFRNVANGAGTWHEASPAGFRTFVDDYTTNSSGGLPPMRLRNYRAQIGNVPTTATRRVVGYYDMGLGQGSGSQVAPITTAGHLAQNVTDLTPAVLAGLDVLFVQNPDNLAFGAEYTSNLANLASAVASGMVLVIHDRCVSNAQTILPGGGGIAIVRAVTPPDDADINVSAVGNLVINGPGGIVGNATLDGGFSSSHGYATVPTLPPWAITILTRPNPAQAVTFAYPYGFGWVVYSTIPLDAYLGGGSSFSLIYAPNVVAYGAFLAP